MTVDVLRYEPDYRYTDEAIEDAAPFVPGSNIDAYRSALDRYMRIERARRNPMLTRKGGDGKPLYRLTESGNLTRCHTVAKSAVAEVLTRDAVCVWCGSSERLEVDHIIRYADGGSNHPSNLRLLCHDCHTSRGGAP